jgi:hypothetical protein
MNEMIKGSEVNQGSGMNPKSRTNPESRANPESRVDPESRANPGLKINWKRLTLSCFAIISAYVLCELYVFPHNGEIYLSYLNYQDQIKLEDKTKHITQWISDDRPTIIFAIPPVGWFGETESMTSLLMTAKKMGWNLVWDKKIHQIPAEKLKNAFGLFIAYSNALRNCNFPTNIPVVVLNNFVEKKEAAEDPIKYINFLMNPHEYSFTKPFGEGVSADEYFKNSSLQSPIVSPKVIGLLLTGYPKVDLKISKDKRMNNLKFIMSWYLTLGTTYYQPRLKKLMFCGAKYPSNVRSESDKYQKLWKKLDETEYFAVYGDEKAWKNFKGYKGYVKADGKSFVKEINRNGICLVMHNQTHLKEGTPSGRIFEAAAAASVIISDKHPFVEREFKDTVLYIDHTRDDLFEQIDAHMQWIKTHPEEAKIKARLAHGIFLQKFTQEQQLSRLYEHLQTAKMESSKLKVQE